MQIHKIFGVILILSSTLLQASPWFTGPILAPAGKTIPRGHINLETYGFFTENIGNFDRSWRLVRGGGGQTTQINPLFSYGLADGVDMQFSLPYIINRSHDRTGKYLGDSSALLGLQLIEQKESLWRPNLRFTVQQIIPTGRYDHLNADNEGTDATGSGSYQTAFALNFQHLLELPYAHYLRTRLSITYQYAQYADIQGRNSFGGNTMTSGKIRPGNLSSFDLAGELTITQHIVAVMEGFYLTRQVTKFKGFPGMDRHGLPLTIGRGDVEELSLAPALEYNFTENYGIIAGVWFSTEGKDAPDFKSTVIAFNAFW